MKIEKILITLIWLLYAASYSDAQCTGGTTAGGARHCTLEVTQSAIIDNGASFTMAIGSTISLPTAMIYSSIIDTTLMSTKGYAKNYAYSRIASDSRYSQLSGSYSNPSWITGLSWSKITSTPTTLAGYGITDSYPLSGNPSGFITASSTSILTNKSGNISQWTNDAGYATTSGVSGTYQTISNLSTDLTSSASKYPSVNAVNTGLGTKEPSITLGTTLQYWRGDKTFQTLNTSVVPESGNLYYLDSRSRSAISLTTSAASSPSYSSSTGVLNIPPSVAGTGIGVSGMTISNTGVLSISSSDANATITGTTTPSITVVSAPKLATARTIQGVSFDGTANINPINGTGFVKASGTTISFDNNTYITGNQTITVSGDASGSGTTAITLTLPNIVTAGTGGIITYNAKGQITSSKKQELFTGTTNASGNVTFTYVGTYGATPNVQYNLGNGASNKESIVVTAKSSTSVTVLVQLRTDIAGLLPTYAAVNGREVDFIITEK